MTDDWTVGEFAVVCAVVGLASFVAVLAALTRFG